MAKNMDFIPDEVLKKIAEFNKEIKTSMDNMAKMAEEAIRVTSELNKAGGSVKALYDAINKADELIKKMDEAQKNLNNSYSEHEKVIRKSLEMDSEQYKAMRRAYIEMQNKKKATDDLIKAEINLSKANKTVADSAEELNKKLDEPNEHQYIENAESAVKRLTFNLTEAKKALEKLKEAPDISQNLEKSADGSVRYNDAITEGNIRLERLTYAQNIFDEALRAELITRQEYKAKMAEANGIYEKQAQDVKDLTDKLKAQTDATKTLEGISTEAYNSMDASLKGYYVDLVETQAQLSANKQQQKELDDLYKNGAITLGQYTDRKVALLAEEKKLKDAQKGDADLIKYTTQLINSEAGSYENLSAQYNLLKIKINQMGEAEGKELKVKRELEKQAKSLYEQMDKQQKLTGKHVLSVGNYKIATEDLTKTVSMLSPALSSAATGIAAVSKQFLVLLANPVVATVAAIVAVFVALKSAISFATDAAMSNEEQMYRLKEANSAISVISDKLTNSVLHPLAEAWIKVSDAIGKGIAKQLEWLHLVDGMTEKTEEYQKYERSRLKLLEYRRIANEQNAADETRISKLQAEAADKANISDEKRLKKLDEIDDINRTINNRKALQLKLELALTEQEAARTPSDTATLDRISDLKVQQINLEGNLQGKLRQTTRLRQSSYNSQKKGLQDQETALERYNKAMKKLEDENTKARIESQELIFSKDADTQKAIITNQKKSYEERMEAANKFEEMMGNSINSRADKQIAVLRAQYDKDVKLADKAGKTMLSFEEEYSAQITTIRKKQEQELNKIAISGSKMREDIYNDQLEKQKKAIEDSYKEQSGILDKEESEKLKSLSESFYKREGIFKNNIDAQALYEKSVLEISKEYDKKRFDAEVESLEEILRLNGLSEQQIADVKQQIVDKRLDYEKKINDEIIDLQKRAAEEQINIEKEIYNKKLEIAKEASKELLDFISTVLDAQTEKQLAALDKQSEENEEYADNEKKRIERLEESGAISKEQADARKQVVDDNAKAREDELEEKRQQATINQAKTEKALKLLEIGIDTAINVGKIKMNTAAAVMMAFAQFGPIYGAPLAASMTALGGVNIAAALVAGGLAAATIAAQPLPQYAHGTDDHKGGYAIVGDGGKQELVITPSGRMLSTPDKPTLMDIPKHSVVMPDLNEALMLMAKPVMLKKKDEGVTMFDSMKQLEAIQQRIDGNISHMNRNNNLGNEALQRELIDIRKMLKRQSLNRSIDRHRMNN